MPKPNNFSLVETSDFYVRLTKEDLETVDRSFMEIDDLIGRMRAAGVEELPDRYRGKMLLEALDAYYEDCRKRLAELDKK